MISQCNCAAGSVRGKMYFKMYFFQARCGIRSGVLVDKGQDGLCALYFLGQHKRGKKQPGAALLRPNFSPRAASQFHQPTIHPPTIHPPPTTTRNTMPAETKRKREPSSEANGPLPDYTITVAPTSDFPPILGLPHLIPSIRKLTERVINSLLTWHIHALDY